eukprot:CAMPEP_0113524968 /NCGR_PEP_ID=MMETSP0014_2-20120614/46487_1 /TAXON_ID=2857 /ORGANISM="Nitzschia sp." /LENGTH=480 /DNA_ID=CAMNT_0000423091 /DNA_START=334 /DNA_END=1776 /DNA_ORIENTATION=+ /assembly_acc=CAM_ASM_000159
MMRMKDSNAVTTITDDDDFASSTRHTTTTTTNRDHDTDVDEGVALLKGAGGKKVIKTTSSDPKKTNAKTKTTKTASITVKNLNARDVLLGRGTGPNEYKGNVYFRSLVRERLEQRAIGYQNGNGQMPPPPLNAKVKAQWAREILDKVREEGGRFLRIVDVPTKKNGDGDVDVDGSTAEEIPATKSSSLSAVTGNATIKKLTGSGGEALIGRQCLFVKVSDAVALDKIKQSFRHQRRLLSPTSSHPSSTPVPASATSPSSTTITPAPKAQEAALEAHLRTSDNGNLMTFLRSTQVAARTAALGPATPQPAPVDIRTSALIQAALSSSSPGLLGSSLGTSALANPALGALTVTALNLERMKQNLEGELIREVSNRLSATQNRNAIGRLYAGAAFNSSPPVANIETALAAVTGHGHGHAPSIYQTILGQMTDPSATTFLGGMGSPIPSTSFLPQQAQQPAPPTMSAQQRQAELIQLLLRNNQC